MAKSTFALFATLLLFILAISEIEAIPKLCEKSSKTYSGKCDNKKCDKKCIEWESAAHGACHPREGKKLCFCYFDCTKKPPGASPAPPGASPPVGGSPPPDRGSPPPADGGSTPPADGGSPPPADGGGGGEGGGGGGGGGEGGGGGSAASPST